MAEKQNEIVIDDNNYTIDAIVRTVKKGEYALQRSRLFIDLDVFNNVPKSRIEFDIEGTKIAFWQPRYKLKKEIVNIIKEDDKTVINGKICLSHIVLHRILKIQWDNTGLDDFALMKEYYEIEAKPSPNPETE